MFTFHIFSCILKLIVSVIPINHCHLILVRIVTGKLVITFQHFNLPFSQKEKNTYVYGLLALFSPQMINDKRIRFGEKIELTSWTLFRVVVFFVYHLEKWFEGRKQTEIRNNMWAKMLFICQRVLSIKHPFHLTSISFPLS